MWKMKKYIYEKYLYRFLIGWREMPNHDWSLLQLLISYATRKSGNFDFELFQFETFNADLWIVSLESFKLKQNPAKKDRLFMYSMDHKIRIFPCERDFYLFRNHLYKKYFELINLEYFLFSWLGAFEQLE